MSYIEFQAIFKYVGNLLKIKIIHGHLSVNIRRIMILLPEFILSKIELEINLIIFNKSLN